MHIERNIFESLFNTVMDDKGKTKDTITGREDFKKFCKRPELDLKHVNGRIFKPKAAYTVDKHKVRAVWKWIKDLSLPNGYASNICRCMNLNE